jgi:hypothetical protein
VAKPILTPSYLPQNILAAISNYVKNPAASSCTSPELVRTLKQYDLREELHLLVESITEGAGFYIENRLFIRGPKLRSRYRCQELTTGKWYFVPGLMEVKPKL